MSLEQCNIKYAQSRYAAVWKLSGPLTRRMAALSDYRDTIGPEQSDDAIVAR